MPSFSTGAFGGAKVRFEQADLSAANANRDGTGTIVDLVTGAAYGTSVNRVTFRAKATTTAGVLRLFIHNGTAWKLHKEILVDAVVPGTGTEVWSDEYVPAEAIKLPNTSYKLGVSTHNAETFSAEAHGNDY